MMRAKGRIPLPPPNSSRAGIFVAAALLTAAVLAAWANSFRGPFIFDDLPAIVQNPTIRTLALPTALAPPRSGQPAGGRPLVNFSFALNWAVAGADVRGYHVLNLAIHVLAALALFGVVRRTLRSRPLAARFAAHATPLAFAVAALWALHPLQTESVTYVAQRAESLGGLGLLLTLYASIRGADSPTPMRWHSLAVVTCLLGMATKEVMYAAPLLVLLHDRTFSAGTLREALRQRRWFYAALAATWLLLAWLVKETGNRGATAGFGLGIMPWHYLLTQCGAVIHYVRLAFWPALAGARLRHSNNQFARSSLAASRAAASALWRHAPRAGAAAAVGFSGRVVFFAASTDFERVAACDTNHRRTPHVFAACCDHRRHCRWRMACARPSQRAHIRCNRDRLRRADRTAQHRLPLCHFDLAGQHREAA